MITPAQATANVQVGHVVILRDRVYPGLRRHGQLTSDSGGVVSVVHAVDASTAWRLPPRILASKQKEGYVPYPVVHACDDIPRNGELLCLYRETRLKTRGGACATPLRDDDMGPAWHDV